MTRNVRVVAAPAPERIAPVTQSARRSICFIVQQQNFGGTEVHTLGLIEALLEHNFDVELVSNRYAGYDAIVADRGWNGRVRIVHTNLDGILYGERADRDEWKRVFAGLSSDIMVLVKGNYSYGQLGFLRECRRAFKRVVFIEHLEARQKPRLPGMSALLTGRGLGLWWYRRAFSSWAGSRYADAIVAVSERLKTRLISDLRYRADKVTVVRNGVPRSSCPRTEQRVAAARARFGIPSDAFVFGMLTRLSHEKGVDLALVALRRVLDQAPARPVLLVVAGDGYAADTLKNQAATLGLQDHVRFLGFVKEPDALLPAYDVILFSSRVEGLPLGLLQGMAAGCLPIVTRISGMPEVVRTPRVGWVVPPEDPVQLAEAMTAASRLGADRTREMREANTDLIESEFDIAESHRRLIDVCIG